MNDNTPSFENMITTTTTTIKSGAAYNDDDEKNKEKHRDVERERRAKLSAYFRQLNEFTRNLSSSSSTRRKANQLDVVEMVTNEFQRRINTTTNNNNEFLNKNELKQLILESKRESVWLVVHASTGQIVEILDANEDGGRDTLAQSYLASRSFYELVHPDDLQKVKSKFSSPSFVTHQTCACSFVCRLRKNEGLFTDNQILNGIANLTSHNALLLSNETYSYETNNRLGFVTVSVTGYLKVIIMSPYEQNYASQLPTSEFVYFMGTICPLEIESNSSEPVVEFWTRHDCTGKIIHVDKKIATILGYEPAGMIGRHLTEFCALPEDREILEAQLKLVYETLIPRESPANMMIRLVRSDTSMSVVACRTRAYAHCNPISKVYELTDCIHSVIP